MESNRVWLVLGIDATKDENEIRQAYHSRLVHVNPEDDPEGFKQLREAYEEAIRLSKQEDGEEAEAFPEGPVGDWLRKVDQAYGLLSSRTDENVWKELLEDEVCLGLETEEEAGYGLMRYCMDHFRIPAGIWKLIDGRFGLLENMDELKERFPADFLQYVENKCTQEEWFPFAMFTGPDDGDYDTYLSLFFEMRRDWGDGKAEEAMGLCGQLEQMEIYHPYQEVMKAALLMHGEKKEEAWEIMTRLTALYPEDEWVLDIAGQVGWAKGEKEWAFGHFQRVAEKNPSHYLAGLRSAQYLLEQNQPEEAKKSLGGLLNQGYDSPELRQTLKDTNTALIALFREMLEQEPGKGETVFKLGWCLLQNDENQQGIDFLRQITPAVEDEAEYHSLLGRFYYNVKSYLNAQEQFEAWVASIEKENPQDEEAIQELPSRFAAAYSLLAATLKQEVRCEDALEAVNKALENQDEPVYQHQKAEILTALNRHQESVDICDRILEDNERYLPALLTRQNNYYHLHMAQQVVDDFYKIKDIYAGLAKPYELAAEVFYIYRQYQDVLHIVEQAEEAKIESLPLRFTEVRTLRLLAGSEDALLKTADKQEKLMSDMIAAADMEKEVIELKREMALCQSKLHHPKEALALIDEAIRRAPTEANLWAKADILFQNGEYEQALKEYQTVEKELHGNAQIWLDLASCHRKLGDLTNEIESLQTVLKINPSQPDVCGMLASCYRKVFAGSHNREDYQKGLDYADRQIETEENAGKPTAYEYIERALLYIEGYEYGKAESDLKRAIELEPENPYAYNNLGVVYKNDYRLEEAEKMLLKAVELRAPEESTVFYRHLGDCYERMGRHQDAEKAYLENVKEFPGLTSVQMDLVTLYRSMGGREMLLKAYDRLETILKMNNINRAYYLCEQAEVLDEMGEEKKSFEFHKKVLKEFPDYLRAYRLMAAMYLYHRGNARKAEKYLLTAFSKASEKDDEYEDLLELMIQVQWSKKDIGKAREYFEKAKALLEKEYSSLGAYLEEKKYRNARLYILGRMYYFTGNMDAAVKCFNNMAPYHGMGDTTQLFGKMCVRCCRKECAECFAAQGMLAEAAGDWQAAREYYERSLRADGSTIEIRCRLLECIRKGKGK